MTGMDDFALYDDDGPVMNDDGSVATFFDLMARVGRIARERGKRLQIDEDPATGELLYSLIDGPAG